MNERFKTPRKPNDPAPRRFTPVTAPAGTLGRVLRLTAAVVVALALVGAGVAALAIKAFVDATPPLPDKSALMVANQAPGMTFEDHDGKVIATRGPRHGHMIMLAELPPYVPRAFLAAEDRRFYQHGPVDLRGVARALRANLKAGHTVQGGSTLTQQLAKTLFLSPDQTLKRKLQEAVIAWRMEQAMSKDEVLALYLNRIFFGDNAYGIDAAAQTYFGKPASGLTIQEAALLAALPKAPTRLALTNDMNAALARSRIILATMKAEGWITRRPGAGRPGRAAETCARRARRGRLRLCARHGRRPGGAARRRPAPDLVVRLSVDPRLQATAQALVRQTIADEGRRARRQPGRPGAAGAGRGDPGPGRRRRPPRSRPSTAPPRPSASRARRSSPSSTPRRWRTGSSRPTPARTRRSRVGNWTPEQLRRRLSRRRSPWPRPWPSRSTPSPCGWPARSAAARSARSPTASG